MRSLAEIGDFVDAGIGAAAPAECAAAYLAASEEILEHWLAAHNKPLMPDRREGFRLLALHHLGAKGAPSFNACRETCREVVYHYNVIMAAPDGDAAAAGAKMMAFVVKHLYFFVSGKLEIAGLGEFCCSSRDLRKEPA